MWKTLKVGNGSVIQFSRYRDSKSRLYSVLPIADSWFGLACNDPCLQGRSFCGKLRKLPSAFKGTHLIQAIKLSASLCCISIMAIREVVWKAYEVFSHPPHMQLLEIPSFKASLQTLVTLTSRLQLSDLGIDPRKLEKFIKIGSCSTFYMSLVDGESDEMVSEGTPSHATPRVPPEKNPANLMTVAAFMVKPRARLPLHDHPKMYGIVKLLHGSLTVQSYSSVRCLGTPMGHSIPQMLVRKSPETIVTQQSDPLVLSKNHGDIHEIWNHTEKMAVFLDILAPPYDFRKCDNEGPHQVRPRLWF